MSVQEYKGTRRHEGKRVQVDEGYEEYVFALPLSAKYFK